jgi:membrane protein
MRFAKAVFDLFKEAAVGWSRDKGPLLAAAVAYYTIFSLAPLLVVSVAVAGIYFGEAAVQGQLVGQIEGFVGREIALTIQLIIENAARVEGSGIVATIIGVLLLFIGASGVFSQLRNALNMIWGITPDPKRGVVAFLKERFLSVTMVLGIGFLLVVSVALSIALTTLRRYLLTFSPELVANLPRLDIAVTLVVITISFAIIFRVLPDAEVAWRDVWMGAAVTALLFALGEYLIGLYLAYSSVGSAFGAAGSLVVVLTWIYYSALILMFGAEFTQVYANKYGSRIRASGNARLVAPTPADANESPTPEPVSLPVLPLETDGQSAAKVSASLRHQYLRQIAAALMGMAVGLMLAFVSSWRRKR